MSRGSPRHRPEDRCPVADRPAGIDRRPSRLRHVLDHRRRRRPEGLGSLGRAGRHRIWSRRSSSTSPWEGFRFYDLIFPLFLFLVGVVIPFSHGRMQERGASRAAMHWRIPRRTALLFALGLLTNRILQFDWENLRIAGVLQRIAICYGIAALIALHTSRRGQVVVVAAILLGYWALLALVPAPGSAAGDYSIEGQPRRLRRSPLPARQDHEGVLRVRRQRGAALDDPRRGDDPARRPRRPLAALGTRTRGATTRPGPGRDRLPARRDRVGTAFPIIKNLWTSSFVLVAGGWSLLLLAAFHGIIDVLGFRRWAFFFTVIGANAITIYVVPRFIDFRADRPVLPGRCDPAHWVIRTGGARSRGARGRVAAVAVPVPTAAIPAGVMEHGEPGA